MAEEGGRTPFHPELGGKSIYEQAEDMLKTATTKQEAEEAVEMLRRLGVMEPDPHKDFFTSIWHGHQRSWAKLAVDSEYLECHPEMREPEDPDAMTAAGHFIGANLPVTETAIAIAAIIIITRHWLRKRKR